MAQLSCPQQLPGCAGLEKEDEAETTGHCSPAAFNFPALFTKAAGINIQFDFGVKVV